MKHATYRLISAAMLLLAAFIFSCSDTESRIPAYLKTAKVIINLGLLQEHAAATQSIIDRVLRFFARDAVAQEAPATFSSVFVRVTGPDMGPIEKTFSAGASISFEVPAGALRQFEVIAYVAPGDPSAAASFRGTGAASLPAGSTVSVLVLMGLYETKIVLPDPFDNVNVSDPYRRLIQINDMSGAGWVEINGDSFAIDPPVMFWPWAVDFDNSGKIYVANNMSSTDSDVILRFNNIHDASPVSIGSGLGSGIISVAIDRPRNIVYYATQNYLRQCDLNGIIDITLTSPSNLDSISALAVGADGTLYIGGSNTLGQGTVWRYNLLSPLSSDYYSGTYTPSDIEVKGSNIYVTYDGSGSTDKIVLLSDDLAFLDGYGMWVGPNPSLNENPGMFYNPRRFVAIRNDALIIIDDANTGFDFDKLVSIRNISGADWTTYGTEGKETGQFQFFYGC